MYTRLVEPPEAERALGIGYINDAQQNLWGLANKGEAFLRLLTHEPDAMQAGPLVEQLINEALGPNWGNQALTDNVIFPDCHPQGMHNDQVATASYVTPDVPMVVNTLYILEDVYEINGGTLIVPGSHRLFSEGGGLYGKVPPAIILEAPAGTLLLLDGRTLHAGAVNKSDKKRCIMINPHLRPFIRHQEAFHLSLKPEILQCASDKLLWRLGF